MDNLCKCSLNRDNNNKAGIIREDKEARDNSNHSNRGNNKKTIFINQIIKLIKDNNHNNLNLLKNNGALIS